MFDGIRKKVLVSNDDKRTGAAKARWVICPTYAEILEENKKWSRMYISKKYVDGLSEVTNVTDKTYVVNLTARTCGCKRWDLGGIPCSHAVSAIYKAFLHPEDFVNDFFKKPIEATSAALVSATPEPAPAATQSSLAHAPPATRASSSTAPATPWKKKTAQAPATPWKKNTTQAPAAPKRKAISSLAAAPPKKKATSTKASTTTGAPAPGATPRAYAPSTAARAPAPAAAARAPTGAPASFRAPRPAREKKEVTRMKGYLIASNIDNLTLTDIKKGGLTSRLNFGVISLIPKVHGTDTIKQFKPIALINVIFKFVAKAYATRLAPLAHRTIDRSQSAFIKGRCLHEGVLALHEIAHELRVKKLKGLLLKLDFEKAFDQVSWDFLREVLLRKGFSPMIVHRLMQLVSGGQTVVNVNGVIGENFRNARGVRQGDPLSPILFDFMVDSLAAIIARATESGHLKGVVPHLIPGGITHLQYADDTLILIEPSDMGLANLKLLLLCFENMLGLKINFAKSEAVVTGVPDLDRQRVADALNCKLGSLPLHYLGLPVSDRPLSVADWNFLTEKVGHRVEPWKGLFLASAGRLELTNSCLSSLPLFAMGLYLLHDTTHAVMEKHRSRFFWEGVGPKRKYHMVDWATVCKPRAFGGLGILNNKFMNIALMLKWIWKIYQNEEGL
ncbi:hypothetical protein QYE76_046192 [Lolium multiflorum]|uniref:Uncharacterized protein n=1 Tax=Lolium multiflorum TaxID=4521 RepID=A0AAD8TLN5_LOLMU|nr:hypothetical protein QYE76_046192 [Lolium multiflorum]